MAQLNADFSASVTSGCSALTVNFSDNSTGSPTSWFWDFGNGVTSSAQNPSVVYTDGGNYPVRLIVKNATEEDYELKTGYIQVNPTPVAGFISTVTGGCVPLQVTFTDTTKLSGISIRSRLWNFGDGTTSSQPNPSHTYTATGKYTVSLTVETTSGCIGQVQKTNAVTVGNKPTANFTATPLDGCAADLRQFTNTSSGNITSVLWNFGDGNSSTATSPQHHYHDTGWFAIQLTVSDNGCESSITKNRYMHVNGPVAKLSTGADCTNKYDYRFSTSVANGATYNWNFGDGATDSARTVYHTYASAGKYAVKLRVDDGTCFDTSSDLIYISAINPIASVISPQAPYCRGDSLQFTFTQLDPASVQNYKWDFGNGESTFFRSAYDTITYAYTTNGTFSPVGFLRTVNDCIDTVPLNPVNIVGVTAGFSNPANGCTNIPVTFTDASATDGSPITEWLWSYGDGTIVAATQPFTNAYNFPGVYNVNLRVTDANGCSDTITQPVNIVTSPSVQAQNDTLLCLGQPDSLKASGASQYAWQANGTTICNPCTLPPLVSPNVTTTYYVTGSNPQGCTATDSVVINVQPEENISLSNADTAICLGNLVQLNASGTDIYTWLPAEGLSSAVIPNPVATPQVTTRYTVAGSDSNGCFTNSASISIAVNGLPSVTLPPDVKIPAGSTYQLLPTASPDVQAWEWLPRKGLSCFDCPNPVATVKNPVTYVLTVYNEAGCSSRDSITIIPICNNDLVFVPNTFSPNNDGMNDYFYPNSKTTLTVKSMLIFNRWGQKVFERLNFETNRGKDGWNGRYNKSSNNLDADVYVYIMQLVCADGSIISLKGNVSLLR